MNSTSSPANPTPRVGSRLATLLAFFTSLSLLPYPVANAQHPPIAPPPNVPIRRAEPVTPTPSPTPTQDTFQNPAWMQLIRPTPQPQNPTSPSTTQPQLTPYRPSNYPPPTPQSQQPFPPPQPSNPPPTALPALPAQSVRQTPYTQPQNPQFQPQPAPVQQPISPTQAEETLSPTRSAKDIADALFARKLFDLALPEYEKFLSSAPRGPDRTAALFRYGECLRQLGDIPRAKRAYEALLQETRTGEFAGAAAYRLASMLMEENLYSTAAANFELAATEGNDPQLRLSALFFAGRCYELLGDKRRAYSAYERVRQNRGSDNRYEEYCLSAMASIAVSLGRQRDAIELYRQLANFTQNPVLREEALLKAAQLLLEANRTAEARELLTAVASSSITPKNASLAKMAILELDVSNKDYSKVAKIDEKELQIIADADKPRAYLLVANATRLAEDYTRALSLYSRIVELFPDSPQANEAQFQRLVCLFRLKDPNLSTELQQFLATAPRAQELAQAQLLLAETYFQNSQWESAAEAYSKIRIQDLPPALQPDAAYKLAWCLARANKHSEAVKAYSDFLEKFPKHELEDQALTGRGISQLQLGNHANAIRDFDRVLQKSPPSPQRELALLNRALAHGSLQQNDRMRADFEQLIAEFPNSQARAQAEFWIGYSKFEAKDYRGSLDHLRKARELDEATYGPRASLRILLANYYLEDVEATATEVETGKIENIPPEIFQWLGFKFFESGNAEKAEKYLTKLSENQSLAPPPSVYSHLAQAQLKLGKFDAALASAKKYEELAMDPAERAKAKLLQSEAALGKREFDRALAYARDAQMLQPEGRINAEARMAQGKALLEQGNVGEAAKTFLAIAVLYDDELLTPQALRSAASAFRKAGDETEAQKAEAELAKRYPTSVQ